MQSDAASPFLLDSTTGGLCAVHDLILLDLDGVVYAGPDAISGAADHLAACRDAGSRLGFITNNASRPPAVVAEHLRDLGIDAGNDDVVTSAQAAARLVAETVPAAAAVLVVGGEGLVAALAEHDLTAVWSARDDPAAVVQGFHPTVGWSLLAEGAYALAAGIPWVASNLDSTVPTDRGRAPGNGALVDVLRSTSGREPQVAGKPGPALFDEAQRRLGGSTPLMVGDRIDTDIVGASRAGMPSLLVLTGVSSLADLCAADGDERPRYVAPGLGGLLVDHPEVTRVDDGWRCGGWQAVVRDGAVRLDGPARDEGAGGSDAAAVAALRAVVAASWAHRDARAETREQTGSSAGAGAGEAQGAAQGEAGIGGSPTERSGDTVDVSVAERRLQDMMG